MPLVHWLRSSLKDWANDLLRSRSGNLHDWLDEATLGRILDDHIAERRDNSFLLWACLQLAGWDRRGSAVRQARGPSLAADVDRLGRIAPPRRER